MHLRLDVADAVAVELDLDFVMLDVPAVYGRQPPEPPAPVGHHAPAAIDQGAATGRADLLALLRIGTAELEDLVVAGLARRDARERLARHDGACLLLAGRAARGAELDASLDSGADALGKGREERPRQVAQPALARARVDLVDLQMIGVREGDDELG